MSAGYTPDFSDLEREDPVFGVTASGQIKPLDREQMEAAAAPRYSARRDFRAPDASGAEDGMHRETCQKCGGTGNFRGYTGRLLGRCFACKGQGYKLFKTSAEDRAHNRETGRARKLAAQRAGVEQFAAEHAAEYAYLKAFMAAPQGGAGFLAAMWDAIYKFGSLTERQLAAVQKFMARSQERRAAAVSRAESAPSVAETINPLRESLLKAKASGLKYVRLTTPQFEFSLAKDSGKNPGCIYVKAGETYLGKITPEGRLQTSRDGGAREAEIVEVCKDPLAAAKLYGIQTGRCGCCGRELTDPESVAAGIGPVCAERYGW